MTQHNLTVPPWFPLHYTVIAGKPLFILSSPSFSLLASEIDALEQYVANGGTLLVINSWRGHNQGRINTSRLAQRFGATLNHDIMVRTDEEAGSPSRVTSSINTLRYNVWVDVQGLDLDLTGLALNEMGTINLEGEWDIRGKMGGEVGRWSVSGLDLGERMPEDEAVIFAARRYGHGAVIVFANNLNWEKAAARDLVAAMLDWARDQVSPRHLLRDEQRQAWEAVYDLQLAVEELYWHYPTGYAASMVEEAWSAYIEGRYSDVQALAMAGDQSLKRPFKPLPSRFVLVILSVLLVAVGYGRDYFPRWLARISAAAAFAIFAGVVVYILGHSVVSTGQLLDFMTRVLFILVAYGLAIITRPLDLGKWLFRVAILGLLLCTAYVDTIPAAQTQDRAFLQQNLIKPDSAPVQLIADEFRTQYQAGMIDEIPYHVEQFINQRLMYRQEAVDLHMSPVETLRYMEEDCDGWAILTASILENLGFPAEIKVNQHHAWVETNAMMSCRLLSPQRTVLYAFNKDGYTAFNITETIIEFIRKMYTGPIFMSFLLIYWPKKFGRVFWSDLFILFVLSLLIVSLPLSLAARNQLFIYLVFPIYFFFLRVMLVWLKQSYQIKIRIVAALMLIGSLVFGIIIIVSLVTVTGGSGNYLLMVLFLLPILAALVVGTQGYFFTYIEPQLKLIGAVLRGKPLSQAYTEMEE